MGVRKWEFGSGVCGGKTLICEILATAFSFWFPSLQESDRADTTRPAGLNIFYSSTIKCDTPKDMFRGSEICFNTTGMQY